MKTTDILYTACGVLSCTQSSSHCLLSVVQSTPRSRIIGLRPEIWPFSVDAMPACATAQANIACLRHYFAQLTLTLEAPFSQPVFDGRLSVFARLATAPLHQSTRTVGHRLWILFAISLPPRLRQAINIKRPSFQLSPHRNPPLCRKRDQSGRILEKTITDARLKVLVQSTLVDSPRFLWPARWSKMRLCDWIQAGC